MARYSMLQKTSAALLREFDLHGVGATAKPGANIKAEIEHRNGVPCNIDFDDDVTIGSADDQRILLDRLRKLRRLERDAKLVARAEAKQKGAK